MPYDGSGIRPIVTTDDDGNEFWQPACSKCGWVGEVVPADHIGYFNQTFPHFHAEGTGLIAED